MLKGKTDKLESRIEVCVFVGYPKGTKGGLFYCPQEKKVITTTNAKFPEEDYLMNHVPRSKLVLQELSNGITSDVSQEQIPQASIDMPLHYRSWSDVNRQREVQVHKSDISLPQNSGSNVDQPALVEQLVLEEDVRDDQELVLESDVVVQPQDQINVVDDEVSRRSRRVIRKPIRFALVGESYDTIPEKPNTEPLNYAKALQDIDAGKWIVAMKSEMESMYSNRVWDLVEPPAEVKPIGCRWIYKKKRSGWKSADL